MRVVGYKWVCVETPAAQLRGIILHSAFNAHDWTRGTNYASYAPSETTLWGFNAYHGALRARWSGRTFGQVMVGLTGFGTVALFQHGWRAEKAEIVAIHVPRRFARHAERESGHRFLVRLAATYDVPVFQSIRQLRRETERWGTRGSVLLKHREHPAV